MMMDGEQLLFCAENIRIIDLIRKIRVLAAILAGTIIGPVQEVRIVKIHDGYSTEVAILSICNPEDTSYVLFSRETERFVNEIRDHIAEVRSSNELLEDLQEWQRKVTTSSNETWAMTSTRKLVANSLSVTPNKASLFTRRIIPVNDKKWIAFQSNVSRFWSRRTTDWRFERLGFNQISIDETVCTWRSGRFRWRKNEAGIFMLFTSYSGTFWWDCNQSRIDELRNDPLHVERLGISQRTLMELSVRFGKRIYSRRQRER